MKGAMLEWLVPAPVAVFPFAAQAEQAALIGHPCLRNSSTRREPHAGDRFPSPSSLRRARPSSSSAGPRRATCPTMDTAERSATRSGRSTASPGPATPPKARAPSPRCAWVKARSCVCATKARTCIRSTCTGWCSARSPRTSERSCRTGRIRRSFSATRRSTSRSWRTIRATGRSIVTSSNTRRPG